MSSVRATEQFRSRRGAGDCGLSASRRGRTDGSSSGALRWQPFPVSVLAMRRPVSRQPVKACGSSIYRLNLTHLKNSLVMHVTKVMRESQGREDSCAALVTGGTHMDVASQPRWRIALRESYRTRFGVQRRVRTAYPTTSSRSACSTDMSGQFSARVGRGRGHGREDGDGGFRRQGAREADRGRGRRSSEQARTSPRGIARKWFDVEKVDMIANLINSSIALDRHRSSPRTRNRIAIINGSGSSRLTNDACTPNSVHYAYDTYSLARGTGSRADEGRAERAGTSSRPTMPLDMRWKPTRPPS